MRDVCPSLTSRPHNKAPAASRLALPAEHDIRISSNLEDSATCNKRTERHLWSNQVLEVKIPSSVTPPQVLRSGEGSLLVSCTEPFLCIEVMISLEGWGMSEMCKFNVECNDILYTNTSRLIPFELLLHALET